MAPASSRIVRVVNSTRGTVVGEHITIADTVWARFIGLLGASSLPPEYGLLLHPSQGIHTLGMKFSIDVVFLDRNMRVLNLRRALKPFRMTGLNFGAASVLELPVGAIAKSLTEVDDQLEME